MKGPPIIQGFRPRILGGSALEVSGQLMPRYWPWVIKWVKEHGGISQDEAIKGGAFYLAMTFGRGHPKTTKEYFDMISGPTGLLVEGKDTNGQSLWRFRKGLDIDAWEKKLEQEEQDRIRS